MTKGIRPDVHPPGYLTLLYLATNVLGDSEAMLRLPSALAGTLWIPAMFLLGRRLFGPEEGLIALRQNPSNTPRWKGPYVDEQLPLDPWDNKYHYLCPGEHGAFDLISYGADGQPGGEGYNEDIVSWKNIGQSDEEYY